MTKSFLHAIKKLLRIGVVLTIVAGSTVNSSAQGSVAGLCDESCNNHINVSLDASGYALIDPMMVGEEVFNSECFPLLKKIMVEIDGATSASVELEKNKHSFTSISALVDPSFVGQKVNYKLVKVYTNGATNICNGTVLIEDKMPPKISCADFSIKSNENIDPFDLDKNHVHAFPVASDNCKSVSLDYKDSEMEFDLQDFDFTKNIKRVWTATDSNGNQNSCFSILTIENVDEENFEVSTTTIE